MKPPIPNPFYGMPLEDVTNLIEPILWSWLKDMTLIKTIECLWQPEYWDNDHDFPEEYDFEYQINDKRNNWLCFNFGRMDEKFEVIGVVGWIENTHNAIDGYVKTSMSRLILALISFYPNVETKYDI